MDQLNPENVQASLAHNAWLFASLALVGVVFLARKFLTAKVPFLGTQAGGAILTIATSFAGAAGTALLTGQPMSWLLALAAAKVAFTAAGGWTLVSHLFTLLQTGDPVTIKADAAAAGAKAADASTPKTLEDIAKGTP